MEKAAARLELVLELLVELAVLVDEVLLPHRALVTSDRLREPSPLVSRLLTSLLARSVLQVLAVLAELVELVEVVD